MKTEDELNANGVIFRHSKKFTITRGRFTGDTDYVSQIFDAENGEFIGDIEFSIYHNQWINNPGDYLETYITVDEAGDEILKPHLFIKYLLITEQQRRKGYLRKIFRTLIQISEQDHDAEGRIIIRSDRLDPKYGCPNKVFYAIGMTHGPKVEHVLHALKEKYGLTKEHVIKGRDGKLQEPGNYGLLMCLEPGHF